MGTGLKSRLWMKPHLGPYVVRYAPPATRATRSLLRPPQCRARLSYMTPPIYPLIVKPNDSQSESSRAFFLLSRQIKTNALTKGSFAASKQKSHKEFKLTHLNTFEQSMKLYVRTIQFPAIVNRVNYCQVFFMFD